MVWVGKIFVQKAGDRRGHLPRSGLRPITSGRGKGINVRQLGIEELG